MTNVSRRSLIGSAAAPTAQTPKRPNLLFIVTDAWRGQALPSAGDPNLAAPNLARLARDGVDCSRAYTSYPVCCPSRAAMLTGKFPHAAGVFRNHSPLPLGQETMSAVLKRAGYRTGYIGKWHLDGAESPGFVPPARRRGFDYWAAYNVATGITVPSISAMNRSRSQRTDLSPIIRPYWRLTFSGKPAGSRFTFICRSSRLMRP